MSLPQALTHPLPLPVHATHPLSPPVPLNSSPPHIQLLPSRRYSTPLHITRFPPPTITHLPSPQLIPPSQSSHSYPSKYHLFSTSSYPPSTVFIRLLLPPYHSSPSPSLVPFPPPYTVSPFTILLFCIPIFPFLLIIHPLPLHHPSFS